MTDVFREVDEDLRRDRLKKLWQRYGRWVIVAAVLVVVAVAVWTFMQSQAERRAAESGDRFNAALALASAGSPDEARAALAELEANGANAYPALAAMQSAAILAETGDIEGAVAGYDAIVADRAVEAPLRDVAALRAALLLVDTAPFSTLLSRLTPLTADGNPFRHLARELLAVSAIHHDDMANARDWVLTMLSDNDIPQTTFQRGNAMLGLIASRGGLPQAGPVAIDTPAPDAGEAPAFDPLDPGAMLRNPGAGGGGFGDPVAPAEGVIPIQQPGFDPVEPAAQSSDEAEPADEPAPEEPAGE
ncbi:MAG: tetratricopeptide repeat protein [Bauldia sp.]|nr:tetratricopeptide repeat protein [Bauldia sp.]